MTTVMAKTVCTLSVVFAVCAAPIAVAVPQSAAPSQTGPAPSAPAPSAPAASAPQSAPQTTLPAAPGAPAAQTDVSGPIALLAEAKRLFETLDYEQTLVRLDTLVSQVDARRSDPAVARVLADALELRARTHYGLGHADQARDDFRALFALDPAYTLGEAVSPRVVTLFKQVRTEVIGRLMLQIDPPDAAVRIDGRQVASPGEPVDVIAGPHVLGILRPGFRPETRDIIVDAARTTELAVKMERTSATVEVMTRPAGAEVTVDGVSRGKIVEGTPLLVADLATGLHIVELTLPCYELERETVKIDQLGDFHLGAIELKPAIGTLRVGSSLAADVYLDGQRRGGAPQTIEKVCAGSHVLEARTSGGRDLRRVDVKAGERLDITLAPRPAIALLANAGALSADADDERGRVAKVLEPAGRVFVLALPQAEARKVETAERAPIGWLARGPGRTPLAAPQIVAIRRDL
jgi:hypothetical protein